MAPTQQPAPHAITPDTTLLRRLVGGDRSALRELRLRYGTTAYAVAYSVVVDPEQAEAAVSDAFAQAWRTAREYVSQGNGVAAWLADLTREAAKRLRRPA